VIANSIPVTERVEAMSLIHDGERCYGAIVRDLITGELTAWVARASCIATGGFGRIYRVSTNAVINQGMGAAIALETGVATLGNMEAIQFHPTAIFPAGILVTEGCRGDGGLLLDADRHRFMPDYEPEKKELASRDVVARRMEQHIKNGSGVHTRYGDHLWLDITMLGSEHIDKNLREVREICQYFLGIDPVSELVPVRPAQHYSMGGIRTRPNGESANLKGLFSCGEAACWDMHGFNRLGGNSVAETVVAGMIVGEYMADFCDSAESDIDISTSQVARFIKREQQSIDSLLASKGTECAPDILREMQTLMTDKVGIFRTHEQLQAAVEQLQALHARSNNIGLSSHYSAVNPELVTAYRVRRMLKLALCVTYGALQRTESRGAHFREDFPERNDRDWLRRTLASWPDSGQLLPTLAYEELNVMSMELPPGWRGYGAKDYIEHPDTASRQAEIEQLKRKMPDADRYEIQHALMRYEELLPERYRGRNQRLGDDDE